MATLLSRLGFGPAPSRRELTQGESPALRGAELSVSYFSDPSGGDFYEFLRVSPNRMLFGLIDVAGKRRENQGICSMTERVFCTDGVKLLAAEDLNESEAMIELAHRINTGIMRAAGGIRSSAAFLGCYNEEIGTVCYVNAGHTPGLLQDDRGIVELPATGLPLGLFSLAAADARTIGLAPRSAMAVVSRGVVEAESRGQEFGLEEVRKVLEKHNVSAKDLSTSILRGVQEFIGSAPRHNDVSALALTRGTPFEN